MLKISSICFSWRTFDRRCRSVHTTSYKIQNLPAPDIVFVRCSSERLQIVIWNFYLRFFLIFWSQRKAFIIFFSYTKLVQAVRMVNQTVRNISSTSRTGQAWSQSSRLGYYFKKFIFIPFFAYHLKAHQNMSKLIISLLASYILKTG